MQLNLFAILLIIAFLISAALAAYFWTRRNNSTRSELLLLMLAITEGLYDGVLLINRKNKIIDFNQTASRLLSINNKDIGKPVGKVLIRYKKMLTLLNSGGNRKKTIKEIEIKERGLFLELRATRLVDSGDKDIGTIIILRDITDAKVAEQKLGESQTLLLNIIDFLPDATFAVDIDGKVIAWNRAMEKISGIKKKDMLGKGDYEYSIPLYGERRPMLVDYIIGDPAGIEDHYNFVEEERKNLAAELKVIHEGNEVHLWLAASPMLGSNNKIIGGVGSFRNITELKNIEKELRHISFHDSLTGLYNRAYFEEELKRLNKSRMLPLSIIIADLNGLKLVNDAFGHDMGDKLLKKASSIIKKSCRSEDIIGRWGGDEFSIVLHATGEKDTNEILDRIQTACGKARFKIPVSLSLGFATKINSRTKIETILKKAEDSMYRNKLISSKNVQNKIVDSLTRTLFDKKIETEISSEKVVLLSKRLGERLGLSANKMKELVLHSKLHDIGKVAVSEKVLKKKGSLDEEEWEKVKKHTEIGYRIANASTLLSSIAEYILSQHEWWDGSGYPRNLKGKEIPLISRIVAVVDSYEVMLNEKPYRKAFSHGEAMLELRRSSGKQFDPELVEEFFTVLKELYE